MKIEKLNEDDWWETWPPVVCFVCKAPAIWQAKIRLEKPIPLPTFSHWSDRAYHMTMDSIHRHVIGMCDEHKNHIFLLQMKESAAT